MNEEKSSLHDIKIPQPQGEILIALRLKNQLKERFGFDIDSTQLSMGMEITHEILKGFVIMETTETEKYFQEV